MHYLLNNSNIWFKLTFSSCNSLNCLHHFNFIFILSACFFILLITLYKQKLGWFNSYCRQSSVMINLWRELIVFWNMVTYKFNSNIIIFVSVFSKKYISKCPSFAIVLEFVFIFDNIVLLIIGIKWSHVMEDSIWIFTTDLKNRLLRGLFTRATGVLIPRT